MKSLNQTEYAATASEVLPDGTANIFDKRYIKIGEWTKADGYSAYFHQIANRYCGLKRKRLTPRYVRGKRMRRPTTIFFCAIVLFFLPKAALSKEWRGIVPLKSTRADVERRFGKPDVYGGYDLKAERVSFDYFDGPCKGLYLTLGEDNCKCLANEGVVMSVFVEPTVKRRITDLRLDMKRFKRTPISPFPNTFEYANDNEGVVYTVDELDDEIKHITYYPSPTDCNDLISHHTSVNRNSWRGLLPLRSTRKDVEALFGRATRDGTNLVTYKSDSETIVVKYSSANCTSTLDWNVPKDTLIELVVNPRPSFLLKELHIGSSRYDRTELYPYPEIDDPPKVWNYLDRVNGISIRTESARVGSEEVVVSITYFPALTAESFRCR